MNFDLVALNFSSVDPFNINNFPKLPMLELYFEYSLMKETQHDGFIANHNSK